MDYAYTLNTENAEAMTRYINTYALKPAVQEDPFLTLASNNTKTIYFFSSLVKDACNDFVATVYDLIGDTYECCDSDSEYSESYEHEETTGSISSTNDDSDISDSGDNNDDDSDISDSGDDNDELSRKIAANEFE